MMLVNVLFEVFFISLCLALLGFRFHFAGSKYRENRKILKAYLSGLKVGKVFAWSMIIYFLYVFSKRRWALLLISIVSFLIYFFLKGKQNA